MNSNSSNIKPWIMFHEKVKLNNFDVFTETSQNERKIRRQEFKWYHIIFVVGESQVYNHDVL